MAHLIYATWREGDPGLAPGTLEQVAERITPARLRGRGHRVAQGDHACICLTGPSGGTLEGGSARLGAFAGAWPEWHRAGTQTPDGSFALVRGGGPVTELCSDAGGTRTLWYVRTDRRFFASTSLRALTCLLGEVQLNRSALAWFLSSGTLGPSDAWDARVRRLPAGAKLSLERAAWTLDLHRAPVVFAPDPMTEAEAVEGLGAVLSRAVRGCGLLSPPWILPLSGGLDSRCLLAELVAGGLRPRTVTWGLEASRRQPGNDAFVAEHLARHYGLRNDYRLTEVSSEPPEAVVDAFLEASGGTTDALFPYLDAMALWTGFAQEGVEGIIRGDEGFGTRPRPEGHHRFSQGIVLLEDFLDPATAQAISNGHQAHPEPLSRRPGESVQTFGDRLVHEHFIPVHLAALTDVKAAYLEVVNPMLAGSVLAFVRRMPDRFRVRRRAYEHLTRSLSPPLPFATLPADDAEGAFLHSHAYAAWMHRELEGSFAAAHLPEAYRASLLASVRPDPDSLLVTRPGRNLLRRVVPTSWVIAASALRPPPTPGRRTVALRCALASRLMALLDQDARILALAETSV